MAVALMGPGGGLTKTKLQLATADTTHVLAGMTFYAGDKALKTGTMAKTGVP